MVLTSCSAQNNGNMNIFKRIFDDPPVCGGTISKEINPKPLENVKGDIVSFSCTYNNDETRYDSPMPIAFEMRLQDGALIGSLTRPRDSVVYDPLNFNIPFNDAVKQQLTDAVKQSEIMKYNKWDWRVAGLPPCYDFYISVTFSSGEKLYMNFNGGRSPVDADKLTDNFVQSICKLTDYAPEKCPKRPPYVHPCLGTHRFVYSKDAKTQEFIFTLERKGTYPAEVISKGDYGYFHARCTVSNLGGRYAFNIAEYCDDSEIRSARPGSGAGDIYHQNGEFKLMPYQSCPPLANSEILEEVK